MLLAYRKAVTSVARKPAPSTLSVSAAKTCEATGNLGCQIWISKEVPAARCTDGAPVTLEVQSATIAVSDPRILMITIPAGSFFLRSSVRMHPVLLFPQRKELLGGSTLLVFCGRFLAVHSLFYSSMAMQGLRLLP